MSQPREVFYPDERDPRVADAIGRYWKKNVTIMAVLLTIWAAAGLGAGILFADSLNAFHLGGYPLGFWFAQQGSILVFVVLILVYAVWLNRLDKSHHEELRALGLQSYSDTTDKRTEHDRVHGQVPKGIAAPSGGEQLDNNDAQQSGDGQPAKEDAQQATEEERTGGGAK